MCGWICTRQNGFRACGEILSSPITLGTLFQRIQLAEVGWDPMIRDSNGKDVGWFVLSLVQPFLHLFDAITTYAEQISLFKLKKTACVTNQC